PEEEEMAVPVLSDDAEGDKVAASDAPADSAPVALEGESPEEGEMAAEDDQMMSAAQMIADEISAMGGDADATAVVAFLQSAAPAIAQLFVSETAEGESSEEVATLSRDRVAARMVTLSRKAEAATDQVHKLSARVAELESERTAREEADRTETLERKLSAAVEAGHIRDQDRGIFVKLAKHDHEGALAELDAAAESPVVPKGAAYAPRVKRPKGEKRSLSKKEEAAEVDALDARARGIYKAARAAGDNVTHDLAMDKVEAWRAKKAD
ncbi:MAG: hypothetical protein AAGH15_21735, partial [Myxococcota bacterium]